MYIYYNRGDGTFDLPPEVYMTGMAPAHAAIGDLTDDMVTDLPDIVVVNREGEVVGFPLISGDLMVFHNSGAAPGTPDRFSTICDDLFLDGTRQSNGNQPVYAVLRHFDSDGLLDIAATSQLGNVMHCLLYTSPSPRDKRQSRMPSSA